MSDAFVSVFIPEIASYYAVFLIEHEMKTIL